MKALATMVRWDAVLNVRQGIVYAALWVMLLWSALLSLAPEAVRVPALISLLFLEISIFALYLLPGFYYLEKGERVLDSQAVAPVPAGLWLLSKTLVFALQTWAVATAITLIAHGSDVRWGWFFAAIAWAGLPLLWLGFACAARYDGISAYLFPSVPLLLGLQAPLLHYWGSGPAPGGGSFPPCPAWRCWKPLSPAAIRRVPPWPWAWGDFTRCPVSGWPGRVSKPASYARPELECRLGAACWRRTASRCFGTACSG